MITISISTEYESEQIEAEKIERDLIQKYPQHQIQIVP